METRWFGFTLLQLCKLLVISDLIIALAGLVIMVVLSTWNFLALDSIDDFYKHNDTINEFKFVKLNYNSENEFHHSVHIAKYWCIAYMAIAPVIFTLELCLSRILWIGLKCNNPTKCRWWLKLRVIILDLPTIYFVTSFIRWIAYGGIVGLPFVVGILTLLYRSFQMSIVFDFITETETGQNYGKLSSLASSRSESPEECNLKLMEQ